LPTANYYYHPTSKVFKFQGKSDYVDLFQKSDKILKRGFLTGKDFQTITLPDLLAELSLNDVFQIWHEKSSVQFSARISVLKSQDSKIYCCLEPLKIQKLTSEDE
jgi:hypothetical protein